MSQLIQTYSYIKVLSFYKSNITIYQFMSTQRQPQANGKDNLWVKLIVKGLKMIIRAEQDLQKLHQWNKIFLEFDTHLNLRLLQKNLNQEHQIMLMNLKQFIKCFVQAFKNTTQHFEEYKKYKTPEKKIVYLFLQLQDSLNIYNLKQSYMTTLEHIKIASEWSSDFIVALIKQLNHVLNYHQQRELLEKKNLFSKLYNIQFKSDNIVKYHKNILNKRLNILTSDKWLINDLINQQHEWSLIFKNILAAPCQKLVIAKPRKVDVDDFFKNILVPKYFNLVQLDLSSIFLETIQFLSFLNAQILKKLQIENNLINSLQSLDKMNFSNIECLSIENNKVKIFNVGRLNCTSSKECKRQLQIQYWRLKKLEDKTTYIQDVRFVAKLKRGKQRYPCNLAMRDMIAQHSSYILRHTRKPLIAISQELAQVLCKKFQLKKKD